MKIDLLNKLADDVFEKIIWATARRLVQEDVIKNSPPCRAKHLWKKVKNAQKKP